VEELESRHLLNAYFVAPTGSDSNSGTALKPWATLQHAVDDIRPGDNIEVLTGTYSGCRITKTGTASAPCTLQAAPGAKVVVNAPGSKNLHGSDIEIYSSDRTVSYWVINGLETCNAPSGAGIDIRVASHITVENCFSHNNFMWGIFLAKTDYPTITHNHCSYSTAQHGIYDSDSGDYATVTYNECDHNNGCGIQFNADRHDGGDGDMVGNLIAENIIHDNGAGKTIPGVESGGGAAINCDGFVSSTIENNLLYNNHAGGLVLWQHDAAVGSHNNVVVNNTIIMPTGSRWAVNINHGSTNNVLYNNIIVQKDSYHGCIEIDASSLSGFESAYNIFAGNVYFSMDLGTTRITLAQWLSKTGNDTHSLTSSVDKLFMNYGANNYHLSATSPAIDAGTPQNAPSMDLDGVSRLGADGIDIGCYAYAG
jgi:parallel beta-helix repeat protein